MAAFSPKGMEKVEWQGTSGRMQYVEFLQALFTVSQVDLSHQLKALPIHCPDAGHSKNPSPLPS